jgi:hypothetical protein
LILLFVNMSCTKKQKSSNKPFAEFLCPSCLPQSDRCGFAGSV